MAGLRTSSQAPLVDVTPSAVDEHRMIGGDLHGHRADLLVDRTDAASAAPSLRHRDRPERRPGSAAASLAVPTRVRANPANATSSSGGLMRPARASRNARSSGPSRKPGPPAIRSASSVAETAACVTVSLARAMSGRSAGHSAASRRVPSTRDVQRHDPGRSQRGIEPTEPDLDGRQIGDGGRPIARTSIDRPAHDLAASAFPDPEVDAGHGQPEPGAGRRPARVRLDPTAVGRRAGEPGHATSSRSQPSRRRSAHPERIEARQPATTPADSRSTRNVPTSGAASSRSAADATSSAIRADTSASRSAGSQVVQDFSPVRR